MSVVRFCVGVRSCGREAAIRNGQDPDDPGPPEPPEPDDDTGEHRQPADDDADDEAQHHTWEPIDLGPYLRGEIEPPKPPSIGIHRSDGIQIIYPGREHSFVGDTESGKTLLALGCTAAELTAGHRVVYIHYEEAGPESTIERLRLLGVTDDLLLPPLFRFIAPNQAAHKEWITALLTPPPALVIHDGINEAMSLHGDDIDKADGAASFRRRLIAPFLRAGTATIACDHLPMGADASRKNAYGSVHKGNAIDGARIALENRDTFGRGMRGRSNVFISKTGPANYAPTASLPKHPARLSSARWSATIPTRSHRSPWRSTPPKTTRRPPPTPRRPPGSPTPCGKSSPRYPITTSRRCGCCSPRYAKPATKSATTT